FGVFMKAIFKIAKLLSEQTALFVSLAALLAFAKPDLFLWIKGPAQTAILGFIMLAMGMTLSADDFRILAKRPLDIFIGACAQYTLMPLLAFAIVKTANLPQGVAVGLLLVGTCPGGVSSNIMSFLAKGDVAFSVGMTTASTLLSPIITPILMLMLSGENVEVDAWGMFKSIMIVTLLPVICGAVLNGIFSEKQSYKDAMKIMPAFGVICLALIVAGVTAHHGGGFLSASIAIFCAIAAHNALGYLSGYVIGVLTGMKTAQRRTISIEVGCQNAGLATNLASTHFQALPEAALASAAACVYHSLSGTILANAFALYDKYSKRKNAE
ncbi:MAG: bile acid:sodium symporter family protein, partial [Opitutales bacterium]|nr:bile acid:sodium symporter family protein [Opitutales bacterium]